MLPHLGHMGHMLRRLWFTRRRCRAFTWVSGLDVGGARMEGMDMDGMVGVVGMDMAGVAAVGVAMAAGIGERRLDQR